MYRLGAWQWDKSFLRFLLKSTFLVVPSSPYPSKTSRTHLLCLIGATKYFICTPLPSCCVSAGSSYRPSYWVRPLLTTHPVARTARQIVASVKSSKTLRHTALLSCQHRVKAFLIRAAMLARTRPRSRAHALVL